MKTKLSAFIGTLLLALGARAAIVVPGADSSDGVLNITTNTEIDLSQAVTGTWNQNNTANTGKGVYDPAKWVVVFKYSSVTVADGATVTFKNHASRAPVMWLVNGPVTINGAVSLNGQDTQFAPALAEAGPGGFRGGTATYLSSPRGGAGFGPGGGLQINNNQGLGASYGTAVAQSGAAYGNPSLIPLIGGSGGAGDLEFNGGRRGGGGGGGALLIASTGTVTVASTGEVRANGGIGNVLGFDGDDSGGGSGGGIRVVCDTLAGAGKLTASGGGSFSSIGGLGRIRVERVTNSGTVQIVPDPSVVPLNASDTAIIIPPAGAPEVKIISIGGVTAPADPRAGFGAVGPDVALPQTASTQMIIETTNVEQASQVQVRLTPRANANATVITASFQTQISPSVLRWTATLPVDVGYSAVQVKVVRP
jgi:hypothetical protein